MTVLLYVITRARVEIEWLVAVGADEEKNVVREAEHGESVVFEVKSTEK